MFVYAAAQCQHQHIQRRIRRWQIRSVCMPRFGTQGATTYT